MYKNLLNAVTTTTTSEQLDVENMSALALEFTAASISSGNGVFAVAVTIDGVNWVTYNMLIDNVTNTNGQNLTRVASKTLSSNTSVVVFFDQVWFKALRVLCTVTTDGAYSCWVHGNKVAVK